MAYLVAANFREGSVTWYTAGLTLTTEQASDANLTAAIASYSLQLDDWTNDHFETEASTTVELAGDGTDRLVLPKRFTAITTVKTRDANGTLTLQSATAYRFTSSLESSGSRRRSKDALDTLDVVPGGPGLSGVSEGSFVWPCGPQTVQVIGTSGWTTTPERVKRAVALLVWDHFAPRGDSVYRAQRWQTEQASYDASISEPSGLPEVDKIVADLKRDIDVNVA